MAPSRRKLQARALLEQARELLLPREPRGACVSRPSEAVLGQALAICEQAAGLDPESAEVFVELASLRHALGDATGALTAALRALRLKPRDSYSYLQLSFRFPRAERRRVLRQGLAAAGRRRQDRLFLLRELSQLYWYEGDFARQARSLRAILRLRRQWRLWDQAAGDLFQLGMVLEALGRYSDAEDAYRQALALRYPSAPESIVLARIRHNDFDAARRALKEFRRRMPADVITMMTAALDVLEGGTCACPREILDAVIGSGPFGTVGRYGFYAALVLYGMGWASEAFPILRRYIAEIEGNRREWGVTNRWEAARARALLGAPPPAGQ